MTDTHYLTKEGLAKLQNELEELKGRRKEVTVRIEEAIKMGDLSENAEYSDAKDEQAFIAGRIAEVQIILKNSEIIKTGGGGSLTVTIGSIVEVKFNGTKKQFTIVGPEEADPLTGFISHLSPLGSAFIDHAKGDKVEVKTPGGVMEYKILNIS